MKDLYSNILKASEIIHKNKLKGGADYIITSTEIAEVIENLNIRTLRKKKLEQIKKASN